MGLLPVIAVHARPVGYSPLGTPLSSSPTGPFAEFGHADSRRPTHGAVRLASLLLALALVCGALYAARLDDSQPAGVVVGGAASITTASGVVPAAAAGPHSSLAQPSPQGLADLRVLAEGLAVQFPGADGSATAAAVSIDWAAVKQACAGAAAGAAPTYGSGSNSSTTRSGPSGGGGKLVLVTGAAGFIGMHTTMALQARGDMVIGLDSFTNYYPVSLKRARQLHAAAAGILILEGDVNDSALLARLFAACPFTHVVHLAAQAGVRYASRDPLSYVRSNVAGFVTLLEAVKAAGGSGGNGGSSGNDSGSRGARQPPAPPVIYASSSSVYGLNEEQPFSESHAVDQPASLYAATKRADELMAHVYSHLSGLSTTGLRFFTVYGPWGRPDMAAYRFAVAMMKQEPITIYQGPQGAELSRDFTFIVDIVSGVLGALDTAPLSALPGQPGSYRIYNLGSTQPHGVSSMVAALQRQLGVDALTRRAPLGQTGDVLATYANISLAAAELGYQPRVSLELGLASFVAWFTAYYNVSSAATAAAEVQPLDWSYRPL